MHIPPCGKSAADTMQWIAEKHPVGAIIYNKGQRKPAKMTE